MFLVLKFWIIYLTKFCLTSFPQTFDKTGLLTSVVTTTLHSPSQPSCQCEEPLLSYSISIWTRLGWGFRGRNASENQWNKLKSLKVAKWRKYEWRMMKDDDFKLLRGFTYIQTDKRTDICDCRVAFATEN